jgi:hypothetical protein
MRQPSKKICVTRASGRDRRRIDAGTRPWFRPVQPGLRTKVPAVLPKKPNCKIDWSLKKAKHEEDL